MKFISLTFRGLVRISCLIDRVCLFIYFAVSKKLLKIDGASGVLFSVLCFVFVRDLNLHLSRFQSRKLIENLLVPKPTFESIKSTKLYATLKYIFCQCVSIKKIIYMTKIVP